MGTGRRGAAGGPSGMTAQHFRPLLQNGHDIASLCRFAQIMAWGEVPDLIELAVRLGRITALQKPDGRVRGIVVGDALKLLVVRTMAQQIAEEVEKATAPDQYALKTKAGSECVAHICEATVVSIDGMGAFDLVSRCAMMRGLLSLEGGGQLLPFVRTFYGQPSTFLWEDETGEVHHHFGAPLWGKPEYILHTLTQKSGEHAQLL